MNPTPVDEELSAQLEQRLTRLSRHVSVLAVLLMLGGLAAALGPGGAALPGGPATPLRSLVAPGPGGWGTALMSLGMVLMALLPTARVATILWARLRRRQVGEMVVTLVVLIELLSSLHVGHQ